MGKSEKKSIEVKCPRCGEPAKWTDNPYRPFCSERCKVIDLGAWASGGYVIPGPTVSDDELRVVGEPSANADQQDLEK